MEDNPNPNEIISGVKLFFPIFNITVELEFIQNY